MTSRVPRATYFGPRTARVLSDTIAKGSWSGPVVPGKSAMFSRLRTNGRTMLSGLFGTR